MARFEVMDLADEDGWVGVVRRYRDGAGEYIPVVAKFVEEYADLAEEVAAWLTMRDLAARGHVSHDELSNPRQGQSTVDYPL